ncbi:MAG TPA: hypothetical protein VL426_06965 [Candidatus Binatia bacterium]|jgi:hypothetical protein|nr:hypothetical protein [Candidatus Binatia bacterium]
MNRNDYCPFCHILVAPAASDRIEHAGQAAHDSCVRRDKHAYAAARNLCSAFLLSRGANFEARAFEIKFAKVVSTRDFGKLVGTVLRKYRDGLDDPRKKGAVTAVANEIGAKLNVDIDAGEDERSSPPAPNGKSRRSRA